MRTKTNAVMLAIGLTLASVAGSIAVAEWRWSAGNRRCPDRR